MPNIIQDISKTAIGQEASPCLLEGDNVYSFGNIDSASNKLANCLLANNQLPKNNLVGVLMENSSEMMITILGILKSGAAFIPLDPNHPIERLSKIVEISDLNLIISNPTFKELGDTIQNKCPIQNYSELITQSELATQFPETVNRINGNDPAYVMFTSGSTGTPKGVVISHSAFYNYLTWAANKYVSNEKDLIFALFTSFAFDLTITSIFLPLITGNKLRIFSGESGQVLLDEITISDVNIIKLTPSHLRLLKASNAHLPHLKKCIVGGEKFPIQLAEWVAIKHNGEVAIFNEYGPTECTVGCMCHQYSEEDNVYDSVPIGKPISNMELVLIGDDNLPSNEEGEAYFKGQGLALGYLNLAELTSTVFKPIKGASEIHYRTGDFMIKQDGKLFFKGRIDGQRKINGHRIELKEVLGAISNNEGIGEAIVKVKTQDDLTFLAAYIQQDSPAFDLEFLKNMLEHELPNYMLPSAYFVVDQFPLNVNGKIDFDRVEEISVKNEEKKNLSKLSDEQRKLFALWEPLISANLSSPKDSFFNLGGNSLKVPALMSSIKTAFGVKLKFRDVFRNRTLEAMTELILSSDSSNNLNKATAIPRAEKREYYPLSQAQLRCWIAYRLDPQSEEYNTTFSIKFPSDINLELLQEAFEKLLTIHPILRARYIEKGGDVLQYFPESSGFKIEVENSRNEKAVLKEFIRPFKLDSENLLRALAIRTENACVLYIDIHHSISDGTSQTLLFRDLIDLYNDDEIANPSVFYTDFAIWQKKFQNTRFYSAQGDYWKAALQNLDAPLELPIDKIRPSKKRHVGDWYSTKLDAGLSEGIAVLAEQLSITEYQLIFSAFACFLNRMTAQKDFVLGSFSSGRNHQQLEQSHGMFVNTLPVRCIIDIDMSFKELSSRLSDQLINALENQDFQFNDIVDFLKIERSLARNPLFPVSIAFQNYTIPNKAVNGKPVEYHSCHVQNSHFDIHLEIELRDGFHCNWNYDTDLFEFATIERFHKAFVHVLNQVIADSSLSIHQISLIDETDNLKLAELNSPEVSHGVGTVLDKFIQIAQEHPEETAIIHNQERISYRELDLASDHIRDLIKKRGSIIGLQFERSAEMVACILGVWKSGSAFVPIEPGLPEARMNHIITDCEINQLLFQKTLTPPTTQLLNTISISKIADFPSPTAHTNSLPTGEDLAYILYTSGSTGKPKGVMIKQNSLANFIDWQQSVFEFDGSDSILQKTAFTFDVSLIELFWPITTGGSMVILDQGKEADIHAVYNQILQNKVTVFSMNPMLLNEFLLYLQSGVEFPSQLKFVITAGDILEPITVNRFYELFEKTDARLINVYGPTEATIGTTWFDCSALNEGHITVPIGKAIHNAEVAILNESGKKQPIGAFGELCITGLGIAKGYVNLDELNQSKFKQIDGKRYYLSGDIARYLPDGNIEFNGRKDKQVKIRGFRIEIGDVEANLRSIEGVKGSVIIKNGEHDLVAFCMLENNITIEEVEASLRTKIPNYMVPTSFMILDSLPYTSNDKIDRKHLSELIVNNYSSGIFEAPINTIEKGVAKAFSETLGIESIGRKSRFFKLGGNSLKTISLVVRLKNSFNVELPISTLFENDKLTFISSEIERLMNQTISGSEIALLFNREKTKTIFAFPPALGHGLVYKKMADYLSDFKIHAFNYVKSNDLIQLYADEIQKSQPVGPYNFIGYSGGGNIAFEVTKVLEQRGEKVSKIIMIDSTRKQMKLEKLDASLIKVKNELRTYIQTQFSDFGKNFAEIDDIIQSYYEFLNLEINDHTGTVDAEIHVINSPNATFLALKSEKGEHLMTDWADASTSGYYNYVGEGDHLDMLTNKIAENTAVLLEITGMIED
jgi:fengycin family lipopeptide synthetase D